MLANIGDSRAVLGTTSDDGSLVAVQLTVDFKPNVPRMHSPTLPNFMNSSYLNLCILPLTFFYP